MRFHWKELGSRHASYYQSLIGMLRWIVELGRVDICLEVLMMSSHMAMPREGHLEQVFHIFAYLKKFHQALNYFIQLNAMFMPTFPS